MATPVLLYLVVLVAVVAALPAEGAGITDPTIVFVAGEGAVSASQEESLRLYGVPSGCSRVQVRERSPCAVFEAVAARAPLPLHAHVVLLWTATGSDEGCGDGETERRMLAVVDALAAARASVAVFLPRSPPALKEWFGDPAAADVYKDTWSGFHPGTTLYELTHHPIEGVRSSLQAHLLSRGLWARVLDEGCLPDARLSHVFDESMAHGAHSLVINASLHASYDDADGRVAPVYRFLEPYPPTTTTTARGDVSQWEGIPSPRRKKWWDGCLAKHIKRRVPVMFRNTTFVNWSWDILGERLGSGSTPVLRSVKKARVERAGGLLFDPIPSAMMGKAKERLPLVDTEAVPYDVVDMHTASFIDAVRAGSDSEVLQYFARVPQSLANDSLRRALFDTDLDHEAAQQFLWVSSQGQVTHTHFDQDHNLFIQVRGNKTFELWPPSATDSLSIAPRLSPWWHKSRAHRADVPKPHMVAHLTPGDALFVPPYWWHRVVSRSPSVSLSTLSRDVTMYETMNGVYRMDHKFDTLPDATGKVFALRLYLDLLIQRVVGTNLTTWLVQDPSRGLLARFDDMRTRLPPPPSPFCPDEDGWRVPTCEHVFAESRMDAVIVAEHFSHHTGLVSSARDILFADFVEEIAAGVVGAEHTEAFFAQCFRGQGYTYTKMGEDLHERLWRPPSEREVAAEEGDGGVF